MQQKMSNAKNLKQIFNIFPIVNLAQINLNKK
jgi:hypothetical protein